MPSHAVSGRIVTLMIDSGMVPESIFAKPPKQAEGRLRRGCKNLASFPFTNGCTFWSLSMSRSVDKILVVNSGSSSLKYMLFDMKGEKMLC